MKILVAIGLAIAAIALAAYIYRSEPDTLDQRLKAEQAREKEASAPSSSVVLKIKVGNASSVPRAANAIAESPLAQEYNKARNLKAMYDRLSAPGGAPTGEAKFYLYKLLVTCGRLSDVKRPDGSKDRAAQRRDLEAMIPAANPDREKRLALFDQATARCEGFENVVSSRADLDKILADAASAGDAAAQARLAVPRMTQGPNGSQMTLSDEQLHSLQTAMATRNPEAILIAGTALANTFDDAVMRVGPNQDELQSRAAVEAWRLIACEYGMDCSADSQSLQSACVQRGQCAANTVQDQVFYYGVSPYEAQLIDQYRQVFRNAVANNDWSGLQLVRQPNTSGSRFFYNTWP